MQDILDKAKARESAQKVNKLITDTTKRTQEQVNWISHKQMKLKQEPGTCFRCGDQQEPHTWKTCPTNGKTCTKCGINDHFSKVSLEKGPSQQVQPWKTTQWQPQGRGQGNRTLHGWSQPVHPTPQKQNIHLLHTATDEHPAEYWWHWQLTGTVLLPLNMASTQHPHRPWKKKYLVTLSMPATGSKITSMTFQEDTVATCNTLTEDALLKLILVMKLTKSPYLLHPYGHARPLKPLGQIDLLCERNKRYESLIFQIFP